MRAEVAIMNRFGVAIAADSAVTVGNERVWKATNKVFSLGPRHDVAVMVYGGGDFLGCPWETIIKDYRRNLGLTQLPAVSDYLERLLSSLLDKRWGSPGDEKLSIAYLFVKELEEFGATVSSRGSKGAKELHDLIGKELRRIRRKSRMKSLLPLARFKRQFGRMISRFTNEIISFRVPKNTKRFLTLYMYEYTQRQDCLSGSETGLVVCGFGADEIYPVCIEKKVDGRLGAALRVFEGRETDLNCTRPQLAVVVPFASAT